MISRMIILVRSHVYLKFLTYRYHTVWFIVWLLLS